MEKRDILLIVLSMLVVFTLVLSIVNCYRISHTNEKIDLLVEGMIDIIDEQRKTNQIFAEELDVDLEERLDEFYQQEQEEELAEVGY